MRISGIEPRQLTICICSNVETIQSSTCQVYGPFEFRTFLGTSTLLNLTFACSQLLIRKDRDLIFGMLISPIMPCDTKINEHVTLTVTFML